MLILSGSISFGLFIFSIISLAQGYHWDGNTMYDLEYQGASFDLEAVSWTSSTGLKVSGVRTTQCGSDRLLGGYNIMAGNSYNLGNWYKTYSGLPAHNTINFKGKLYMIDYWKITSDHFHIYFDSQGTQMWSIGSNYNYATVDRWGRPVYKDLGPMMIYFTVPHTSSSLTFRISNHFTYASQIQSIGFRDIVMTFSTKSPVPSKTYCGVTSGFPLSTNVCGCGTGTTMSPVKSGLCTGCDASCLTCKGPNPTDCTSCNIGEYLQDGSCFFCNSTCLTCNGDGPTRCTSCQPPLRLSNGICYECDDSCETCTGPGPTECASCITSNYLSGGSCFECDDSCASCSGPSDSECTSCTDEAYLSGGACYPCDGSCLTCNAGSSSSCTSCAFGEYLSSGSCHKCHDSCLSCDGAGDSACTACDISKYLVGGGCYGCDSSCLTCDGAGPTECATCVSKKYLVETSCYDCDETCAECTGGDYDECISCIEDYWLVGSVCYDSCDVPLLKTEIGGINYCETPCLSGEYAYFEGGCDLACDYPRTPIEMNTFDVCGFPCGNFSEYYYWNGSCFENCPEPLSKGFLGPQNFCDFPCEAGEFLYWNGTCESSCPGPFISETQGTYEPRKFCWFPCESDEYLYWNASCLPACPYPLKQTIDITGAQFCHNPCGEDSDDYLYSNQSCRSTCPNPLGVIENPGVNYCINPCSFDEETVGYFLYDNQTCMPSCLSPFRTRIEPNVQYCDRPCGLPNIFWYRNRTCLPGCKAPYVQSIYSGVVLCLPPCKDSEYYYEYDKECHSKCPSPYKSKRSDIIKVCYSDVPISLSETEKIQDTAAGIESQGQMASGGMKAASAMNSGSPGSALLAGLSSMLQYIRYMKINYPPKVQMLFLVSAGSPISLGFDFEIPSSVEKKLIDNELPDVFEKYDINSNFVNNLWDSLMTLMIVLVVIGILSILKLMVPEKKYPRISLVLSKLLGTIRWNVPIMLVCSSSGDIFFYASLQIRSSPLDSLAAIICFCMSLVMMTVVFMILIIGLKILRSFKRHEENSNWSDKWKGYEILYEEYEEKSIWSLSYMILFIIRGIIFNLTVANLFDFPLIQCIIINITNVLMLGYLLYLRPLKNFLGLVQLFVNEGLVNIIGVSIIILAIMDKAGIRGQSTRVSVGDAIYFVIQTFNTFGLVFMGIGLLVFLVALYRAWKQLKAQKITSPLKIFKALVFGETVEQQNTEKDDGFPKRTKIKRARRKQSRQPQNETNEVIYINDTEISQVEMVHADITINDGLTTNANFWPNINVLQTECQEEASELQITQLNIQQSFDLPVFGNKLLQKQENSVSRHMLSIEKSVSEIEADKSIEITKNYHHKSHCSFRNRKLIGRMKSTKSTSNMGHHQDLSAEKSQAMTEMNEKAEVRKEVGIKGNNNDNSRSGSFIQEWGRLKNRMNRTGNVTYEVDSSSWFKNIKKLKTRLRNNSTTINLTSENENKN